MTDIYEGYLSPKERKEAIADAKLDNLFERCYMMYEMVQLRYDQNVREAELKVLNEGGTYDDLAYLIEEAGEEANDKRKGLIGTLIDGIVSLFKQLGEAVRKLFVKDGVEVEADEGIMSGVNTFDKMFSVVERTFSGGIVQGFLKTAGIVEGCKEMWNLFTSIPTATGKMRKYASDGVNKAKEILAKICDWIAEKTSADKAEVEKMEKDEPTKLNEDKGEGWSLRKVFDFFKDVGKKVREQVNSLAKSLGEKLRDDGSNDENGDNQKPSDPKTIMSTIQKDAALSKNGWYKNGDKYDKDSSKIISKVDDYLNSERYKEILTNSGVKDVDNKDGERKQYDDKIKKNFGKWVAKDPANKLRGNDNTQKAGNPAPAGTNPTQGQNNNQQQGNPAPASANPTQGQNNDPQVVTSSALDDYIDELDSAIYENSMSDYEYHSLVSAIDALF